MRSLATIEQDIQTLQLRRAEICSASVCCEGAEYSVLMRELTSVDRKLLRRRQRRTLLIAARSASGFGFLGDFSRG